MATTNKDFRIKNGLIVDGANATVNGNDVLTNASSINALSDVTISSPTSGQVLKWNGSAWINDTDATGGGGGGGTLSNVVEDTTPQLGGDLDAQNFDITNLNSVTLTTSPTSPGTGAGTIFWDSGDGIAKAVLNANVTIGLSQESVIKVKNATGSTITKGSVVYINGAQGQMPTIALADADTEATSSKTFGFAAEAIADGAEGFVITEGVFRGANTATLTEGGPLYLSTTAGEYTQTIPAEPAHMVFLGYVVKAHASAGEIVVKIQNGYELTELHGVLIANTAETNDILQLNSSGIWVNANLATANIANLASTGTQTFFANIVGKSFTTTGVIAANGGNISTSQFTATLFNENATTINFGGAATTVNIGATGGTTTFAGNVTAANIATSGLANVGQLTVGSTATFNKPQGSPPFTVVSTTEVTNLTAQFAGTANAVALANVTGLGTNVATFLATPNSLNLLNTVTDETGTGSVVFATSPTLTTPNIGAATGTSVNVTGQLISTVATGTAPLAVTSTTVVTNLTAQVATRVNTLAQFSTGGDPNTAAFITYVDSNNVVSTDEALRTDSGLMYYPLTDTLQASVFNGSGAQLTNIPAANISGTVSLTNGGTGATTATNARINLETPKVYTQTTEPAGGNVGDIWIDTDSSVTTPGIGYVPNGGPIIYTTPTNTSNYTATYTPTAGVRAIRFTLVGGGGGGAGSNSTEGVGGGGGAGAYAMTWTTSIASSYTITVGAGGAGGPGGATRAGTAGNTTSVVSSTGTTIASGAGGAGAAASGSDPGLGGNAGTGTLAIDGGDGAAGGIAAGNNLIAGNGGNSFFGGGGRGSPAPGNSNGGNGRAYGSGGGGSRYSTSAGSGGDGKAGIIIIEEFV